MGSKVTLKLDRNQVSGLCNQRRQLYNPYKPVACRFGRDVRKTRKNIFLKSVFLAINLRYSVDEG